MKKYKLSVYIIAVIISFALIYSGLSLYGSREVGYVEEVVEEIN